MAKHMNMVGSPGPRPLGPPVTPEQLPPRICHATHKLRAKVRNAQNVCKMKGRKGVF